MQRQRKTAENIEKGSREGAVGRSQYITEETESTLCLKLLKIHTGRSEHRLQGNDLKECAVRRLRLQIYRFWEKDKKEERSIF